MNGGETGLQMKSLPTIQLMVLTAPMALTAPMEPQTIMSQEPKHLVSSSS